MKIFTILLLIMSYQCCAVTSASVPSRITHIGPDLNKDYDAEESAVAFNSQNNEYFIVYEGTQSLSGSGITLAVEVEIFAQRIDAITGANIGATNDRISNMGTEGDTKYDARNPDVVYNSQNNEYLVVWYGDSNTQGTIEGEFEIWGKRINANNGNAIGSQFRISNMGPVANRSYDAIDPVVSYNSVNNEYMVVWRGEDGNIVNAIGEFEIYGQQINANGTLKNSQVKISDMGIDNQNVFDAYSPDISYNKINNEYLIVWYGDDNTGGHVSGEFEIYGQRLNALNGAEIGSNDFLISETGVPGFITRSAQFPSVSWDSKLNQYLVVWSSDPATGAYVGNEFEIFGQLLSNTGVQIGNDDFAISDVGPVGNNNFDAFRPKVEYIAQSEQFLVAYRADTSTDGEFEIFYQRLDASTLIRLGKTNERLSHAGPDNSLTYDARRVELSHNSNTGEAFIVWEQEDQSASQSVGELEIYSSKIAGESFVIDYTTTGSWYDIDRNGEGYIIEMLPNNKVLMIWFTYLPNQTEQAWLIGIGSYHKNRITIKDMKITSGGVFGTSFDSNLVKRDLWGELSFEFDGCSNGVINYNSSIRSYNNGDHQISRLTSVSGANCGETVQSNDPLNGITGSWYDPTHDGEGWMLEYLGNNKMLMYWFTYDDLGNQKWFISLGDVDASNTVIFNNVTVTNGTSFGDGFDANLVNRSDWGTIEMNINNCNSITVNYNSTDAIFGQGVLDSVSLTRIDQLECQL